MSQNAPRTKWSQYERWLKPVHLTKGSGKLTIATIEEFAVYDGHGKTDVVPVAQFKECRYALILTNTNRRKLAELFGDDIDACTGKRIVVEVQSVRVGPQHKQVVRITGAAPARTVDPKTGEISEEQSR